MLFPLQPSLHKQNVLSCMKLGEHLFLLFFSLWGWGEGRRRRNLLRMSSFKSSHKHCIVRVFKCGLFFCCDIPRKTFHILQSALRIVFINLILLIHGALCWSKEPRRLVTCNPCKPCPHNSLLLYLHEHVPPPSRAVSRAH